MHELEVFYDGDCPLCLREVRFLRWLDRERRVLWTDIAHPQFDEGELGLDWDTLMDRIHARRPDGTLVTGVEVFRGIWSALGWTGAVRASRWRPLARLLDWGYELFARHRLRLTGRCRDGECRVARRGLGETEGTQGAQKDGHEG